MPPAIIAAKEDILQQSVELKIKNISDLGGQVIIRGTLAHSNIIAVANFIPITQDQGIKATNNRLSCSVSLPLC